MKAGNDFGSGDLLMPQKKSFKCEGTPRASAKKGLLPNRNESQLGYDFRCFAYRNEHSLRCLSLTEGKLRVLKLRKIVFLGIFRTKINHSKVN